MSPTGRTLARRLAAAGAVVVAVATAVVVAAGSDPAPRPIAPAAAVPTTALAARHTGPQGQVGQFVATCGHSHSGDHDPIVHHGHAGASHRHDFYGAAGVDASSTAEDLLGRATTCDKVADTAAYWHPTLYDGAEAVEPLELQAYYRAAPGVEPSEVEPYPLGLALVAGDRSATESRPGGVAGWSCGVRTSVAAEPPDCPPGAPLHLVLTFQDCWDGVHLDSEDHASHAAYSAEGACPASHPVHLPQLTVRVRFPLYGSDHDLSFSSGSVATAHGDFLNAWEPDGLRREIEACIHRDVVCNLGTNRAEDPLFTG